METEYETEQMDKPANDAVLAEVPRQIFEATLGRLRAQKAPDELIQRLRKALVQDVSLTEPAIRDALFGPGDGS